MEILSSITGILVEYTVKPIGRQLSYVCFFRHNIRNLTSRVQMLKDTKDSVQHRVSEATRNAQNIESAVLNWLTKVDQIIENSETILVNQAQQGKLCLNLVQRHQLSRKAVKMTDEILEIRNEGNFERVSYVVALSEVENSKAKSLDFLNFESRKSTMEKIIGVLMDDSVNIIGVHGMGGVGKTMLVKEISRIVMEKKLFDQVVTLTVSQTPDLKRIQGQLGDKLGLKFDQETEEGRALQLQRRLKMEKKILIVLDDVWKQIDLETIGIPSIPNHTGCKILFTSRESSIFFNDMCPNVNFEIQILQEDETWNLFRKMSGEIVETSDLKSIAIQIARECAHLPIAITTVAKALRNKPLSIWKDALDQLRNPVAVNIRGMNEKVYSSLKLSYDQLECEEAKSLFLLCSMFPEDDLITVEDLHVYVMGMDFLCGVDTVVQRRNRITKLIDDLISSSLLLKDAGDNWFMVVKMHDIVRDVAILIASKDDHICTLTYLKGLDESWHEEKTSGNHTVVYLNVRGLRNPPQKLMLPKVQLLVLCGPLLNGHELPHTFFGEMKELRILELKGMKFSLLPQLLSSFANLRSLRLLNCKLENIEMIGELNRLESLDFDGSDIIQIPTTIRHLTQLKVLSLSNCHELKIIPPNTLLNLTKLEELYLETFNGWEKELNEGRRNASLSELRYLSHLRFLGLWIQDEEVMPKQLLSRELNLEMFMISIGCKQLGCISEKISRVLCLKMETESCMEKDIKMLLRRSEELHLVGSVGARVLHYELNENDSSHLKHLYIHDDSQIRHFIHEQNKPIALSNLERLELRNLENLEIGTFHCHSRQPPFNKLKVIKLSRCNKVESIFSNPILDDLLQLEKIKILDCEMMKAIIVMGSEKATDKIELTNLKSLRLEGLPQLQSFFSKIKKLGQLSLDNLEKDETSRFNNGDSFFIEQVSLPNLEVFSIKGAQNLKMIFNNALILNSFSKLKSVVIGNCNNLEKVFPSNIMSRLTCLEVLQVESCNLLEGVFEGPEPNVTKKSIDLLPNLRELKLSKLPNLQYIWEKDPSELLSFENIKILSIDQCPKLKRGYPIKVLQQLEKLEIDLNGLKEILRKEKSMQMLRLDEFETSKAEIIQFRDDPKLFLKLKRLSLFCSKYDDDRWTHLPMEIVGILHNLEMFRMEKTLLEEIFPIDQSLINVEECQNESYKLSKLYLYELPKLRHLWNEGLQKNASILENLKDLTVSRCGILDMLVPSSMSFRNLTWLRVEKCHKLTYLLNPSVARTLVQLEFLILEGCKRMKTVIARGVEEEKDEILFSSLILLKLTDFSKLKNFHSGKCTIRFPRLPSLGIRNCPEMRDFSLGIVSTPLLLTKNIGGLPILKDSKETMVEDINVIVRQAWDDNYDTNIQNLFEEQNLEENQFDPFSSHAEE